MVIDFYKKVNEIPSNEINNKKLTLNTIRTMEDINKKKKMKVPFNDLSRIHKPLKANIKKS